MNGEKRGRPRDNWFRVPKSVAEQIYSLSVGRPEEFVAKAVAFYIANKDKIEGLEKLRYQRHYRDAVKRERTK